ncbi:MAG: Fur family transcriptional regulator [Blastocatellales bacterium]
MARLEQRRVEAMVEAGGLKMTPQRRSIVDYLQAATNHPTAEEVLTAVNEKFPLTTRATVYNTLNWLKQAGLIREVFEAGVTRFDPNTSDHHHFICRVCGRVEDVEGKLFDGLDLGHLDEGKTVEHLEVTLRGVCSDCQIV